MTQKTIDHSTTSFSPTTVNVNTAGVEVGTTAQPFSVTAVAAAGAGGTTNSHTVSGASTNATVLKAGAGRLYNVYAINTSAADKFVKFYNKATAPVVGTDVPVKTFKVPANGVLLWDLELGSVFTTGIAFAITGLAPDTDATATAAGDVILDTERA